MTAKKWLDCIEKQKQKKQLEVFPGQMDIQTDRVNDKIIDS